MNYYFKKITIAFASIISFHAIAYGAVITINAPEKALANRQPITVQVFLDSENDTISGISGNFSYDADLFSVDSISAENSVVSLWIKQPSVSQEIYLDGRTHITFEGIFPGGYSGVRSPYYQGVMPGKLFTVRLIPKNNGVGNFMVDNIVLNAYNSEATQLKTESVIQQITVPRLTGAETASSRVPLEVKSNNSSFITRDSLVNNNAWYLVTNDTQSKSAIDAIYVAETDDWTAHLVDERMWKKATNEYILSFQKRTKYVHIKIIYSDGTYALTTLPPVENSTSIPRTSRILGGVAFALLVLYLYAQHFFFPLSKKTKHNE